MRDWDLSIFITTTNQVVSLSVNPQFTTEHVVKELISSTLISNGSYCLKIDVNGILIRLEDTKPLISIDLLRDKIVRFYSNYLIFYFFLLFCFILFYLLFCFM